MISKYWIYRGGSHFAIMREVGLGNHSEREGLIQRAKQTDTEWEQLHSTLLTVCELAIRAQLAIREGLISWQSVVNS
jgi:hypothetical protein